MEEKKNNNKTKKGRVQVEIIIKNAIIRKKERRAIKGDDSLTDFLCAKSHKRKEV